VVTNFTGTSVSIDFADSGENYFEATITDLCNNPVRQVTLALQPGRHTYDIAFGLPDSTYRLEIFKRTESLRGATAFLGLRLDPGRAAADAAPAAHHIQFFGDSITAGACDEDPGGDQWDDPSTHDNYNSYGAVTARALAADYVATAVSGIGLTQSYGGAPTMAQLWNRRSASPTAPAWDFAKDPADLVVINLGQNDFSLKGGEQYSRVYLPFLAKVRAKYPHAKIFCVLGPMAAGRDQHFKRVVSDAVSMLQSLGDHQIYSYFFHAQSTDHPRLDVHAAMARELSAFIESKLSK
jgi:hypothetical protein